MALKGRDPLKGIFSVFLDEIIIKYHVMHGTWGVFRPLFKCFRYKFMVEKIV